MENQSSNSASCHSRSPNLNAFNIPPIDSTLIGYLQSRSRAASPQIDGRFDSPVQSPAASPLIRSRFHFPVRFPASSPMIRGGFSFPVPPPASSPLFLSGFRSPVPFRSPRLSLANFYTPPSRSPPAFKVEEDVVVMDGIPVIDVTRGNSRSWFSSSSGPRGRSLMGTESMGSSSSGSVSWQWDDSPRQKAVQRKEEFHPIPFTAEKKIEADIPVTTPKVPIIEPKNLESSSKSDNNINSSTLNSSDWSPLDDGIDCSLPTDASTDENPSREAVDTYIDGVLDGTSCGKRLHAVDA